MSGQSKTSGEADLEIQIALLECVAASLLHAVANHTNVIVGRIGILELARPEDAMLARVASEIRAQVDGISAIAATTRAFVASLSESADWRSVEEELGLALEGLRLLAHERGVELSVEQHADVRTTAPIRAIAHGLVGFGIRSAGAGEAVCVTLSHDGDQLTLSVALPHSTTWPATRRELTSPWLSGAGDGDARGRLLLGLALGAAREHGGGYVHDGARIAIQLPVSARESK